MGSSRAVDPDQMVHGVVVGLGRSSSRVADFYYSDSSAEFPPPAQSCCTDRLPQAATIMNSTSTSTSSTNSKDHHQPRSFFPSCFTKSSSKAASKFPNWPKSPSHFMSRLLLSPDMSPDRIMSIKSPSAGDQSPARSKSRFTRSSNKIKQQHSHFFSGPLIPSAKKKNSFDDDDDQKEEPTSPKVTCMGTVKAPKNAAQKSQKNQNQNLNKKLKKKKKKSDWRPPVNPKVKKSIEQQQQQQQPAILDLSRFGGHSGELRPRPGQSVYGKSLLALQQQQQQQQQDDENENVLHPQARKQYSLADCKKPMRVLVQQQDQQQQQQQQGDWNRLQQQQQQQNKSVEDFKRDLRSSIAVIPRSKSDVSAMKSTEEFAHNLALKRPEEICLWKRRCIPEPLRLNVSVQS